jgi:hypothetical protein
MASQKEVVGQVFSTRQDWSEREGKHANCAIVYKNAALQYISADKRMNTLLQKKIAGGNAQIGNR